MPRSKKVYGYCGCFFERNIFLKNYRLHVHFYSEEQFRREFSNLLRSRGCISTEDFDQVLRDIEAEIERRKSYDIASYERSLVIRQSYIPKHACVYNLKESFLAPEFLQVILNTELLSDEQKLLASIEKISGVSRVFRLPVFTADFCRLLVEELDHFRASGMPRERPNTMNQHGLLLGEILTFNEGLLTPLREYLRPLCAVLFPEWGGASLDTHRGFTVHYTEPEGGGDFDLATHHDNAEVTLNVCLSDDFEGGELTFGEMREEPPRSPKPVHHRFCSGLLHRGQHMHGAVSVTGGRRTNLILWLRSSNMRRERGCPRCRRPQADCDIREASGFGDGFLFAEEEICPTS